MCVELTTKAQKLLTLCDKAGLDHAKLTNGEVFDSIIAGICLTEGCDHVVDVEGDQEEGWCDECQSNTVVSALILAGVI